MAEEIICAQLITNLVSAFKVSLPLSSLADCSSFTSGCHPASHLVRTVMIWTVYVCFRGAPHPRHASSPGGLALACFSPLRYLPWCLKHVFLPSLSTLLSSLPTSPSCQSIHSRKPEMSAGSYGSVAITVLQNSSNTTTQHLRIWFTAFCGTHGFTQEGKGRDNPLSICFSILIYGNFKQKHTVWQERQGKFYFSDIRKDNLFSYKQSTLI